MRVLIVDDEAPARRELRAQLAQFGGVEVVGEATHVDEAKQLIGALSYDVVFLDIELPGKNGVQLARELAEQPSSPRVVFTTAFAQYAVDAFRVGAVDYLLKPFDEERLGHALTRLGLPPAGAQPVGAQPAGAPSLGGPSPARSPAQPPRALERLPVEKGNKTVLLAPSEAVFVFTQAEEVFVKTRTERFLSRATLRELEQQLEPLGFVRTHRQFLVNLHRVREVVPLFKGTFALVVDDLDHTEIPVSRALAPDIRTRLGLK